MAVITEIEIQSQNTVNCWRDTIQQLVLLPAVVAAASKQQTFVICYLTET